MLMSTQPALRELEDAQAFQRRHIGPDAADQQRMLSALGAGDLSGLMQAVIPASIRRQKAFDLPAAVDEAQALKALRGIASGNRVMRSYIGQGYFNALMPGVIQRNVLENPAWYTAYTPYQPEISQGRLEALLNFQTMVADLTGMDVSNASMLDEATAAAEAMTLALRSSKSKSQRFFVADDVLPQTLEVLHTRAAPLGIEVVSGAVDEALESESFGVLLQYPGVDGAVRDDRERIAALKARGTLVVVAADLLALTLLMSPGELGADIACGTTQRFGLPLGLGGPHAGYLAVRDALKRSLPGRLVGVSQDAHGQPAYRLALQTREQHIRREKATSNICTAQVLPAVLASMYAVYHGPEGLRRIAQRVHAYAVLLARGLEQAGLPVLNAEFFDTLTVHTGARTADVHAAALSRGINFRRIGEQHVAVSLDETVTRADLADVLACFGVDASPLLAAAEKGVAPRWPQQLARTGEILGHPVFRRYHSETEMLRYLRRLADKDIALDRAMIPLGSCTMKLNATSEMIPITWPAFANVHPFAPADQQLGYKELDEQLRAWLCQATGYAGISLQPNAGSQGEYAGLLVIKAWHASRGESHRNICLIPSSAHGTNPASAQMVGMTVVVTKCDENGNVDMADLAAKCEQHSANLAAAMITYPSTHGVFETTVKELCALVHQHGGRVYVDGANMNALVGVAAPGEFGGDVSHLNLHKTFCIPHGGGGPGVGPVCVVEDLVPFLPGHATGGIPVNGVGAVSAAPLGNAAVLPISWMYIRMMGADGLKHATEAAILSANYISKRLKDHYPTLYASENGHVAHECILDLRHLKETSGVMAEDVAKRLMDHGFHAPTLSFPVVNTLMVEPTESETLGEIDRFIDAMIAIRDEIRLIENGTWPQDDNPLKNAPHTASSLLAAEWTHPYSREVGAASSGSRANQKYWPPVGRVDNVYGDRNLFCSCLPISELA